MTPRHFFSLWVSQSPSLKGIIMSCTLAAALQGAAGLGGGLGPGGFRGPPGSCSRAGVRLGGRLSLACKHPSTSIL
jgi:hypothetical protein